MQRQTAASVAPGPAYIVAPLLGLAMLVVGLFVPVATVDRLLVDPDTYSILGGIGNLLRNGNHLLAVAVTGFSVIFPIGKYVALLLIAIRPTTLRARGRILLLLRVLGKWSMLDTFIIAVTFGAANLGILSDVAIHWGIYLYGTAVLLSILISLLLSWRLIESDVRDDGASPTSVADRSLHLLSLLLFLGGLIAPLAQIEKWLFWQTDYSLLSGLLGFINQGEVILPLLILLFVILMPLLRFLMMGLIRWRAHPGDRVKQSTEFVDEWAMFDVYVLAMGLVFIKLSDNASVTLQAGFWLLAAAAILSWIDSARLRHQLRTPTGGNATVLEGQP